MPPLTGQGTQPLQKETTGKRRSFAQKFRQGAPADFPGVVIPNPDNVKPLKDTDPPPVRKRLSYGGKFSTKNFKGRPTGDTSNGRQLWPEIQEREQ